MARVLTGYDDPILRVRSYEVEPDPNFLPL